MDWQKRKAHRDREAKRRQREEEHRKRAEERVRTEKARLEKARAGRESTAGAKESSNSEHSLSVEDSCARQIRKRAEERVRTEKARLEKARAGRESTAGAKESSNSEHSLSVEDSCARQICAVRTPYWYILLQVLTVLCLIGWIVVAGIYWKRFPVLVTSAIAIMLAGAAAYNLLRWRQREEEHGKARLAQPNTEHYLHRIIYSLPVLYIIALLIAASRRIIAVFAVFGAAYIIAYIIYAYWTVVVAAIAFALLLMAFCSGLYYVYSEPSDQRNTAGGVFGASIIGLIVVMSPYLPQDSPSTESSLSGSSDKDQLLSQFQSQHGISYLMTEAAIWEWVLTNHPDESDITVSLDYDLEEVKSICLRYKRQGIPDRYRRKAESSLGVD